MSETAAILEKSFAEFVFEIWPNAPRLRNRLRLFRAGHEAEIDIDQRSLEVLELLLSHKCNEVVPTEEITKAIWGADYWHANLHTHISELRKHLDDDARNPKFIRTVHGEGYSFIFEWKESSRPAPAESAALSPDSNRILPVECSYIGTNRQALQYLMERYHSPETPSGKLIQFRDTHVRPELPMPRPEDYAGMQEAFSEFLRHANTQRTVATMILGWHIDEEYVRAMQSAASGHGENLKMFRLRHAGPLLNFIILDYEQFSEVLFGWGQGKPGTPGAVFKSADKRMVDEFGIFYDFLLDHSEPLSLDSVLKSRPEPPDANVTRPAPLRFPSGR